MASSVALVNKDIARHYQLQNLLAPPEAIELTKLYNEMSDILSKPVKFRNKPMQLHLFYDLLSQYSKHLSNLKMDTPAEMFTIPEPPLPTPPKQQTTEENEESFDNADDMDSTVIDPDRHLLSSTPQLQSRALVPFTPMTEMSKFLKMITKNVDTPRKVMQLLAKNDPTFQYNPDDKSVIIQGKSLNGKDFVETLEHLRNPNMKPRNEKEKFIIEHIIKHLQSEDHPFQKRMHSKLPGLKNYFIELPMVTRTRKPVTARHLDLDSTAVTHSNVHEPKKISKTGGKGRVKKIKHKPLKIHWKRWQSKIRYNIVKI